MKDTYWDDLSDEYLQIPQPITDENAVVWYETWKIRNKDLLDNYGGLSWLLLELAQKLRMEEISESRFRELTRFCLDKELK